MVELMWVYVSPLAVALFLMFFQFWAACAQAAQSTRDDRRFDASMQRLKQQWSRREPEGYREVFRARCQEWDEAVRQRKVGSAPQQIVVHLDQPLSVK
ncbi:MAG TPA: hypothetical protein VHT00_01195 [Stellaceae bacterium]|nr:hypothetical protein [Stellaceae bacterium]